MRTYFRNKQVLTEFKYYGNSSKHGDYRQDLDKTAVFL